MGKGENAGYQPFSIGSWVLGLSESGEKIKWWKGIKELQESMDRCTGHWDITEILLKTTLNTLVLQSINQNMLHGKGKEITNTKQNPQSTKFL